MKSLFCDQKYDSDVVPQTPDAPVSKSVPQPNCPFAQVSFPVTELHVRRFAPYRFDVDAVVANRFVDVADVEVEFPVIVSPPLIVEEAEDMNPLVRVDNPETVSEPRVPREVRDELTTVEPRVVAESIEALLIRYERPDAILISFEA